MKGRDLIKLISKGVWLMTEEYAAAAFPIVEKLIAGEPSSRFLSETEEDEIESHYFLYEKDGGYHQSYSDSPEGSVLVSNYAGVVMKETVCGEPGTAELMNTMKAMDAKPNISAHLLVLDSGGGAVDGTFEFAAALKSLNKPVVAYVDGTCASAAYAMAMNADKIIASSEVARIGSIGVMTTFRDMTKRMEAMGVEQRDVYSDTSMEKNSTYRAALTGDDKPLKAHLTAIDKIFMDGVKSARAGVSAEALKGGTFLAQEAIDHGLIDEIGSMEDAVNETFDLIKK